MNQVKYDSFSVAAHDAQCKFHRWYFVWILGSAWMQSLTSTDIFMVFQ